MTRFDSTSLGECLPHFAEDLAGSLGTNFRALGNAVG
jgi:hypothetical protein